MVQVADSAAKVACVAPIVRHRAAIDRCVSYSYRIKGPAKNDTVSFHTRFRPIFELERAELLFFRFNLNEKGKFER